MRLFKNEADNYCIEFKDNEAYATFRSLNFAIGALYSSRLINSSEYVLDLLKMSGVLHESIK